MVEHRLHTAGVTGSNPVVRTEKKLQYVRLWQFFTTDHSSDLSGELICAKRKLIIAAAMDFVVD